jgi:hypothetical protein
MDYKAKYLNLQYELYGGNKEDELNKVSRFFVKM